MKRKTDYLLVSVCALMLAGPTSVSAQTLDVNSEPSSKDGGSGSAPESPADYSVTERIKDEVFRLTELGDVPVHLAATPDIRIQLIKKWAELNAKKAAKESEAKESDATESSYSPSDKLTVGMLKDLLSDLDNPEKLGLDEKQLQQLWAGLRVENQRARWEPGSSIKDTARGLVQRDLNVLQRFRPDSEIELDSALYNKVRSAYEEMAKERSEKYGDDSIDPVLSLKPGAKTGRLKARELADLLERQPEIKDKLSDSDFLDLVGQVRESSNEARGSLAAIDREIDQSMDGEFRRFVAKSTKPGPSSAGPVIPRNSVPRRGPIAGLTAPPEARSSTRNGYSGGRPRNSTAGGPSSSPSSTPRSPKSNKPGGKHGGSIPNSPARSSASPGAVVSGGSFSSARPGFPADNPRPRIRFFIPFEGDQVAQAPDLGEVGQKLEAQQQKEEKGFSLSVAVTTPEGQHACQITLVKDADAKKGQIPLSSGGGRCLLMAATAKHCVADRMSVDIPGVGLIENFRQSRRGIVSQGNTFINGASDISIMRFEGPCVDEDEVPIIPLLAADKQKRGGTILADGSRLLIGKAFTPSDPNERMAGTQEIDFRYEENPADRRIFPGNSGGGILQEVDGRVGLVGVISSKWYSDDAYINAQLEGTGRMATDVPFMANALDLLQSGYQQSIAASPAQDRAVHSGEDLLASRSQ